MFVIFTVVLSNYIEGDAIEHPVIKCFSEIEKLGKKLNEIVLMAERNKGNSTITINEISVDRNENIEICSMNFGEGDGLLMSGYSGEGMKYKDYLDNIIYK